MFLFYVSLSITQRACLVTFTTPITNSQDDTLQTPAIDNLPQVSPISQPLSVYRCRQPHVKPPSATVLTFDSRHPPDYEVNDLPLVMPSLQRSARVSVPLDRYEFNPS